MEIYQVKLLDTLLSKVFSCILFCMSKSKNNEKDQKNQKYGKFTRNIGGFLFVLFNAQFLWAFSSFWFTMVFMHFAARCTREKILFPNRVVLQIIRVDILNVSFCMHCLMALCSLHSKDILVLCRPNDQLSFLA